MKVLFDSSIYIRSLRDEGGAGLALLRWLGPAPIWGSSVVLEELYAGVSSRDHRLGNQIVQKIELEFERANRLLVPNQRDWSRTGQLLNRIANKYGYESIGRSRLTNDALIASSAARCGIEVITANARDFALLAEFCPLQWRVG
jgi:predicted nucleic acid-binding protein